MRFERKGWIRVRLERKSWIRVRLEQKGWIRVRLELKGWIRVSLELKGWIRVRFERIRGGLGWYLNRRVGWGWDYNGSGLNQEEMRTDQGKKRTEGWDQDDEYITSENWQPALQVKHSAELLPFFELQPPVELFSSLSRGCLYRCWLWEAGKEGSDPRK